MFPEIVSIIALTIKQLFGGQCRFVGMVLDGSDLIAFHGQSLLTKQPSINVFGDKADLMDRSGGFVVISPAYLS